MAQPTGNCALPSQRLDPFISHEFGQRHTLSVSGDIVLLSVNSECGVDVKAHRQPLCSLPEYVSVSRNINLTWGQVFPAYSLL